MTNAICNVTDPATVKFIQGMAKRGRDLGRMTYFAAGDKLLELVIPTDDGSELFVTTRLSSARPIFYNPDTCHLVANVRVGEGSIPVVFGVAEERNQLRATVFPKHLNWLTQHARDTVAA